MGSVQLAVGYLGHSSRHTQVPVPATSVNSSVVSFAILPCVFLFFLQFLELLFRNILQQILLDIVL